MMNMNILRESIKTRREQLSPMECMSWSENIAARCLTLPAFATSEHIAIYIAHRQEVDPTLILAAAWKMEKKVYLPVLAEDAKHLYFVAYTPDTVLQQNRYGIYEPHYNPEERIGADHLDLVITPLVAFDKACHRVGMGAGFYDRSFYFLNQDPRPNKPIMIGLAYDFQEENDLTHQPWDVNLNFIVTQSAVYSLDREIE